MIQKNHAEKSEIPIDGVPVTPTSPYQSLLLTIQDLDEPGFGGGKVAQFFVGKSRLPIGLFLTKLGSRRFFQPFYKLFREKFAATAETECQIEINSCTCTLHSSACIHPT